MCRDYGRLEWAGTNLDTVFCQRRNLLSLRMWRMLFDVVRFNQFALELLRDDSPRADESHRRLSAPRGLLGTPSRDDYLIPMAAAVWSTSPDKCALEFPAVTLVRFL